MTNNTLTTSPNCKWTIKENKNDLLLVDVNNYELKLFRKPKNADTVKSLYDFLSDEHNGNAATLFIREANARKQRYQLV